MIRFRHRGYTLSGAGEVAHWLILLAATAVLIGWPLEVGDWRRWLIIGVWWPILTLWWLAWMRRCGRRCHFGAGAAAPEWAPPRGSHSR